MEPAQIQALAIVSLCAFAAILVTAVFYVLSVRPRLLAPETGEWAGGPDLGWRDEWAGQQAAIQQLSSALDEHSARLSSAATRSAAPDAYASLQGVLSEQTDAVRSLERLVGEQASRLDGLDERLERLADTLDRPQAVADRHPLNDLIQAQADRLMSIGTRMDQWSTSSAQGNAQLAEHARILADLDRELAAQAQAVQRIDTKVSEHTTMLVTAATERREQMGVIERLVQMVGQIGPLMGKLVSPLAPRPAADQDRLTEIKGIGPVYASKFYEAGVKTFKQLSTMTADEVLALLNLPAWRLKSVDPASWIEQAEHLASLSEKVEQQP